MFTQRQIMALIKIQHTLPVTAMAATLRRQHNAILLTPIPAVVVAHQVQHHR